MPDYRALNLFDSGPSRLHVRGLSLRHALLDAPSRRGTQLHGQGVESRTITQAGTLIADDEQSLGDLKTAIESCIDGQSGILRDEHGQQWDHVVMLQFEPEPTQPLGPRRQCGYTIQYVQVSP